MPTPLPKSNAGADEAAMKTSAIGASSMRMRHQSSIVGLIRSAAARERAGR